MDQAENKKENPSGFMLIDKPDGPTSHDIVRRLRRISGIKKIGHSGTLDPFASGLLIIAIGRQATKNIARWVKLNKTYEAEIIFGFNTDTYDRSGKIIKKYKTEKRKKAEIKSALRELQTKTKQIPPMYSAKKVGGRKLYQLARENIEIERPAQNIKVYEIKIMKYDWPKIKLKIHCSSGTYIRSLTYDLGRMLKCGACLQELRRIAIGSERIKKAVKIDDLTAENWMKFLRLG